ncbi:unnamed protein product [Clavelina lepadiformis]|uniref:G-protein coupled receptors family 1 profile domain-containing protein n=1 Tax=Clavelina lepadiformis TaxID=159417 RepID=A0ABP0F8F0_CLALP
MIPKMVKVVDRYSGDDELWDTSTDFLNVSTRYATSENDLKESWRKTPLIDEILGDVLMASTLCVFLTAVTYQCRYGYRSLFLINLLCNAAAFFQLVRAVVFQIDIRAGHLSKKMCNAFLIFSFPFIIFSNLLPYIILWMRQRSLNRPPNLLPDFYDRVKKFSAAVLCGIIIPQIVIVGIEMKMVNLRSTPSGCQCEQTVENHQFNYVVKPVLFTVAFLAKCCLLALVLYPVAIFITSRRNGKRQLQKRVMRLAASISCCILADLVDLVVIYAVFEGGGGLRSNLFLAYINTFVILLVWISFADYRYRFLPFGKVKNPAMAYKV